MKKKLLFLTLGLLAFAKVQSVSAQCTITQNTISDKYSIGLLTQVGQSFRPTCSGTLSSIQFIGHTSAPGTVSTVTVKIVQKANCTATTTVANTLRTINITNISPGTNNVSFANLTLTANTDYYIEFTASAAGGNSPLQYLVYNDNGNSYPNGAAYYITEGGTCTDDTDDVGFSLSISGGLPVELTQFDATTEGSKTQLTWSTASEKNNEGFEIERGADGAKFEKIGFVKGNGTSNETKQYTYEDNRLSSAVTYYRLKQVDFDGTFTYSKVVSVVGEGSTKLKAYPNPVATVLMLETAIKGNYEVINLLGQTVLRGQATAQMIDVSALPQGNYILKVGSEQVKFFKQ